MANGHFNPDPGTRGGSPAEFSANASASQRGGFGAEFNNVKSSSGFRRALMKTSRNSGRLKDQLPDKSTFNGPGFKKPSSWAQGGRRHGLHLGSGAAQVQSGQLEGEDFGQ